MLSWHVIHTKPSREAVAAVEIARTSTPVFLPLEHYSRHHNHRREARTRPLFPRYVFARFDHKSQPWGFLGHLRGVSEVLCSCSGSPAVVPDQAIDAIRNRPEPIVVSALRAFAVGQRVRIEDGPLRGYEGLYQGSPHQRVTALLDILGRKVEIPLAVVSAA